MIHSGERSERRFNLAKVGLSYKHVGCCRNLVTQCSVSRGVGLVFKVSLANMV